MSNTGLDSHHYSISIDWLRLRLSLGDDPQESQRVISLLSQCFICEFEVSYEGYTRNFQKWDGFAKTPAGISCWWSLPKVDKPAYMWVDISGTACQAIDGPDLRDAVDLLSGGYNSKCTRIDIAFDDFTKALWQWDELCDAARDGNYAGPRTHNIHESSKRGANQIGFTVYFGSRESAVLHRFYDKALKSKGVINSNRGEAEFKDTKAEDVFMSWVSIQEKDVPQYLFGVFCGSIRFVDRSSKDPNLDRLPTLPWWDNICHLAKELIRIPGKRIEQSIERTMDYLVRISGSIYALKRVQQERFEVWLEAMLEEGRSKQKPRHDALVATALARAG